MRDKKKANAQATREKVVKLAQKIPTEMLAKEWMSDNDVRYN